MKESEALFNGTEMTKNEFNLSIIVPTYNEEDNIIPLHDQINDAMKEAKLEFETIFIDDGSTDKTYQILKSLRESDERMKIIKFRKNYGQSAAMAAGFDHARGNVIITLDADLQNDPADIPKLLHELNNGYDVVCGWRYNRKDSITKRLFSKVSNWLGKRLSGESIHDSGCSMRAYKNGCVKDLELYGEMHRYIPALLSWKGYKIGEVKVKHRPRTHGKPKYNWQRLPKGFLDLLLVTFWQKYSLRPIHIFGGAGIFLAIAGVILGIYLIIERMFFGVGLGNRPLPLLAVLMLIIGIQFIVFGMLADIMIRIYYRQGNRKNYIVEEMIE
jgi:glycosyltransferase involved in cell wall biosynthesis